MEHYKLVNAKQLSGLVKSGAVSRMVQLCVVEKDAAESDCVPPQVTEVLTEFAARF